MNKKKKIKTNVNYGNIIPKLKKNSAKNYQY